ncbi:MAG: adenylate/guanylate cyclase domain-containing protein, partial [SAR324 cluster bacterium]|nr:adenylate/guanylate cyclase domain-containing protein [SAR324 cluster bacterium]
MERSNRRLAAILSADAVGYSRLMQDDEEATLCALTESRTLFADHVRENRGRVVNAPGDSVLAEFASVVDAVNCAVAIQQELAGRNRPLPEQRRMHYRIGVNLGDVLVDADGIYGDGVNIAARLESLAEPGGICVSRTVHDQVSGKLSLGFEYLGEKPVKNIAQPVRVYRVLLETPPREEAGPVAEQAPGRG